MLFDRVVLTYDRKQDGEPIYCAAQYSTIEVINKFIDKNIPIGNSLLYAFDNNVVENKDKLLIFLVNKGALCDKLSKDQLIKLLYTTCNRDK